MGIKTLRPLCLHAEQLYSEKPPHHMGIKTILYRLFPISHLL